MSTPPQHPAADGGSATDDGAAETSGPRWSVRLLGALEAHGEGRQITHFPTRAAGLLLARLALAPDRAHPREELVELLWPGVALDVGRNRLRQALSALKSLLESDGRGPVILADRLAVRAAPGGLASDAVAFERHLRSGDWDRAEPLLRGELLPGFYEDWVIEERGRLSALAERLQDRPRVPATNPGPRATGARSPGQLPSYWTRLYGTEISASRLRELVRHQRLVTVFGAGGSGKTRLAVEVARALAEPTTWAPAGRPEAEGFAQVVFVSLVDCHDAAQALDAIASALRAQGGELLKSIAEALAGERTLLLLDNVEQLVGQIEAVVQQLLTDSGQLHVLITSRQRLNIDGEQIFEQAGLPLPQWPRAAEDTPMGQAAVALFIDRARAASADFSASPAQERALVELVRLLAGMPLAIELAASRMRNLSPVELLGLLNSGQSGLLDLLARDGRPHDLAQRHASMRHVVAWSWQQLGPALVDVMQSLAVFGAPATAESVAAVAVLTPGVVRERLAQLRDQSMVVAQRDAAGVQRYSLLQPVREFVIEHAAAGEAALRRRRLRQWVTDFGRAQAARGYACIADVEAELPSLYGAMLGAPADGPTACVQAVEAAVALRRHWEIDTRAGLPLAVMDALQQALPHVQEPALRCEACVLLSFSKALAGFMAEAAALAAEALVQAPDPGRRARALLRQARVQDQTRVDDTLAEALQLAREVGDLETQAIALRMQFLVAGNRDDDDVRAESLALQGQQLWERVGHRRNAYSCFMDRASCWMGDDRLDAAATALAACEQAALQERYPTGSITASWQLGRAGLKLRRAEEALAAFRRCLQESWQHKRLAYVADALVQVPGGLAFTGQVEAAARLQAFAVAHWQRQFGGFYRELERDVQVTRRWLRQHLGAVRFEALRLEGLGLSMIQAVALGLGREVDS